MNSASINNLVPSERVRSFFSYENRASFWKFVRTKGVPHIVLNARRIMFDPVALNRWIAKHDTSGTPRYFTFGDEPNQASPVAGSMGLR